MRKLYLHIGPHKTGSTYLQGELLKQHSLLLAEGILYPDSMLEGWGHTGLANAIKSGDASCFSAEIERINQFDGDVILSSENFFNMSQEQIASLRSLFHFDEVRIVAFYRQPTIRLLSLWHEFVKSGMSKSYSEFALPHVSRPLASNELNILRKIRQFRAAFEGASVAIVDYDRAVAEKATVKMFFAALGVESSIEENWSEVNKRVSFRDVEVIRCLNSVAFFRNGALQGHELRMAYFRHRNEFTDILDGQLFPMMNDFMEVVSVGGTHADRLLQDAITREFPGSVDVSRSLAQEVAHVPQTMWMFHKGSMSALAEIYNRLSGK